VTDESVLTVSVVLRSGSAQSAVDRGAGQVTIPIWHLGAFGGSGIVRTWLLLGRCDEPVSAPRSILEERLRMSLMDVPTAIHAPRICITLLEGASDPADIWPPSTDEGKSAGHDMLLASHAQHVSMFRAYAARWDTAHDSNAAVSPSASPCKSSAASVGSVEDLIDEQHSTLDALQREANRRIEIGNETLRKLQLKLETFAAEEPELVTRHSAAKLRLAAAKQENAKAAPKETNMSDEEVEAEMEKLRMEAEVLASQKEALMKLVADIYAQAGTAR